MGPEGSARPARTAVAAYILAGGASQRMGVSKARLDLGGVPLAWHLAHTLAPHVSEVRLVAKPDQGLEDLGVPMLYDATAERALVHGIRTVLEAPGPDWRFICACDMPNVGVDILARLWQVAAAANAPGSCLRRPDRDACEPLPSLWRADVATRLAPEWGLAAQDWIRAAGLVEHVATAAEQAVLVNLNTQAEWDRFAARRPPGVSRGCRGKRGRGV